MCDEIIAIDSISRVQDVLDGVNNETLVLFDCDNTLIMPSDKLAQKGYQGEHIFRALLGFENEQQEELVLSRICLNLSYQYVELVMHDTIMALKKRGIKILALTAQPTGRVGIIESFERWRFEKLKLLGIDFSLSFVDQLIVFDHLLSTRGNFPLFYRGILCASIESKGKVLGAFLDKTAFKPAKVLFFDDSREYVQSVAKEMKKRAIDFQGYVYKAAQLKPLELDLNIARFQIEYLKKYEVWLSDEQAARMMSRTKK